MVKSWISPLKMEIFHGMLMEIYWDIYNHWLVVWNLGILWLSIQLGRECHHPNGRTPSFFQRGRHTTNQINYDQKLDALYTHIFRDGHRFLMGLDDQATRFWFPKWDGSAYAIFTIFWPWHAWRNDGDIMIILYIHTYTYIYRYRYRYSRYRYVINSSDMCVFDDLFFRGLCFLSWSVRTWE